MKREMILAGFGGQGVLSMGLFLAHAGMCEGKHVSYVPAYGAEMRGGTANCTVIISEDEISSPVVAFPETIIAMNHPSLDKFEPLVKKGGLLLVNQSLIHRDTVRDDIDSYEIPCQELADEAGFSRGSNMVMLGALLQLTQMVNNENIYEYLVKTFKGRYLDKMPLNQKTIEAGMDYVKHLPVREITNIA
ncbi:MAG: 2-oxoacid:acceptor oxidoreductase family protein [Bacillota bacterium]|nr:2-oxoacid:acceptor oxidoreductase family protein [Bacillota bacterium]